MESLDDGRLRIIVGGPASEFGNNLYLLVDRETGESAFVDAPCEPEKAVALADAHGARPSRILLTHSHGDHTAGIEAHKARFGCMVVADATEPWLADGLPDIAVSQGEMVELGSLELRALSVPGHTPGSTTYLFGNSAFVGDTLFPGGPGRTRSPEAFQQELESITRQLYALPDSTVVYPGHGARTTIGESKAEYAVFAAREHVSGLHGDVTWHAS
jgi:glyoxylase-like metal-dependent hydrolase (beta-lactamase superfamily II)